MKRHRVVNDQIQRVTKEVARAIDGMDKPDYDYKLCVELATAGMRELVELNRTFQAHLDAGTLLEEVEVYTETIYHTPWHDLIQYWRLLPGSDKLEHLFPGCPGFVSSTLFLDAIGEEYRAAFEDALKQEATPRTLPGEQVPAYEGQEGVDWFHEDDVRADNPALQLDEDT